MLNPYISFRDKARSALEFYHSVFGGELTISTFKDYNLSHTPADDNLVMHGMISANGLTLMAADTPADMEAKEPAGISISLSGDNAEELRGYWNKLSEGGMVAMPLEKAPWGDEFGMLVDKFGISWMVNIAGKKA